MREHVLVTGGAGYVGSHTCKALARAGFTPVVYDNLVYGHRKAVQWGPFEHGDISDRMRLGGVIAKYRPAAVLHFAAFTFVGESVSDPMRYYSNNVAGALTLFDVARQAGIRSAVFSSTAATYGVPDTIPITESAALRPVNPYGRSKLMVEEILRDFEDAYAFRSVCLRYFNAAGADPDGELGEEHDPETHLIPLVLSAALGKTPAIRVFGDDYPTPDGTCIRDYVHVSDLADAHVRALAYVARGGESRAFNVGTGKGVSVKEVIGAARRVTARTIPVEVVGRRPGDPAVLVASAESAEKELGWRPAYPEVATSIEHAWGWTQKPHRSTQT
jgi:UDP-arabinose 4-epimerase